MSGTARWQIGNQAVTLRQETRYPADGHIRLTIEGARGMKAALRIPDGAGGIPCCAAVSRYRPPRKKDMWP